MKLWPLAQMVGRLIILLGLCMPVAQAQLLPDEQIVMPPLTSTETEQVAPPLQADMGSLMLPPGLKLKVMCQTAIDSRLNNVGDAFLVETQEDVYTADKLVLPKGSTIRGRIEMVKRPSYFSQGGLLKLQFHHVVLPTGEIQPIQFKLDAATAKLDPQRGGLYTDAGVGNKLGGSVDKGVDQFKFFRDKGLLAAEARGGGFKNKMLTMPTNTIAGVATGTAVTSYNAVKSLFGRGDSVALNPGDILILDFSQPTQLPVQ